MVQRSKEEGTLSLSTILVSQQAKLTFLPPVEGNRRPRDYTPPASPVHISSQAPSRQEGTKDESPTTEHSLPTDLPLRQGL